MYRLDFIDRKINALWSKKVSNASDAYVRAEEIAWLQKIKAKKLNTK